eukprot:3365738-Alexandrium_andersonii.AAC.1
MIGLRLTSVRSLLSLAHDAIAALLACALKYNTLTCCFAWGSGCNVADLHAHTSDGSKILSWHSGHIDAAFSTTALACKRLYAFAEGVACHKVND